MFLFSIPMKHFIILFLLITTISIRSQNLDFRILNACNTPHSLKADGLFKGLSASEAYVSIALPITLGVVGALNCDSTLFSNAIFISVATISASGISYVLKDLIERQRPFDRYPNDIYKKMDVSTRSFPSGHTTTAFATATSLSLAYPKWYIIAPAYVWAGSVAFSRLYLGVHYPSDVLAGVLIGTSSAYVSYKANNWLMGKIKKKKHACFL